MAKVRGITIKLDAEYASVLKAFRDITAKCNSIDRSLKDVNKLLKLDPGNLKLISQQTDYFGERMVALKQRLIEVSNTLHKVRLEDSGTGRNIEQIRALEREYEALNKRIQTLKSQRYENLTAESQRVAEAIKRSSDYAKALQESLKFDPTSSKKIAEYQNSLKVELDRVNASILVEKARLRELEAMNPDFTIKAEMEEVRTTIVNLENQAKSLQIQIATLNFAKAEATIARFNENLKMAGTHTQALEKALKLNPGNLEYVQKKAHSLQEEIALTTVKLREEEAELSALKASGSAPQVLIDRMKTLGTDILEDKNRLQELNMQLAENKFAVINAAIEATTERLGSLSGYLSAINDALKIDPSNVELTKAKFDALNAEVAETEKRLESNRQKLAQMGQGDGTQKATNEFIKLQTAILKDETELKKLKGELSTMPFTRLDGDIKNFQNSMAKSEAKVKSLNAVLKSTPANVKAIADKEKELTFQLNESQTYAARLRGAIAAIGQGDTTPELIAKQKEYEEILAQVENRIGELNALLSKMGSNPAPTQINTNFSRMNMLTMAVAAGLSRISSALTNAGKQFYTMAEDAETSFQKVQSIVVANGEQYQLTYDKMYRGVMEASEKFGVSVTDFNEALYQSISAAQESGKAIKFTADAIKLARGGFTDATTSVDILTTLMNTYGESAKTATEYSDMLITVQNRGKTTVGQLAAKLGAVAPIAKTNGVEFEYLAAAMATLTKRGVNTSTAAVGIRQALNELGKDSSAVNKKLAELGKGSFRQMQAEGENLFSILNFLQESLAGTGVEVSDLFSNMRSKVAISTLMADGLEDVNFQLHEVVNSAGASQKAFDKMNATPAVRLQQSLTKLKNVGIDLGYSLIPVLERFLKISDKVVNVYKGLSDANKELLVVCGGAVAVISKLAASFMSLNMMVQMTYGSWAAFGAAITPLLPVIGGVAAGTVALVGALALYNETEAAAKIKEVNSEFRELNTSTKDAKRELDGIFDTSFKGEAEATIATTEDLINRLSVLETTSTKDEVAYREMCNVIDELNSIYPELNLYVDENTKKLSKSVAEVRNYTNANKESIKAAAYQKKIQEAVEASTNAYSELIDAQIELKRLEQESPHAYGQLKEARVRVEQLTEAYNNSIAAIDQYEVEMATLGGATKYVTDSLKKNVDAQVELDNKWGLSTSLANNAAEALANMAEEEREAVENFALNLDTMFENISTNIQNQMGMFTEFKNESTTTMDAMISGLDSQLKAMEEWENNLAILMENGIDQDLIQTLAAAGPESGHYAAAIVQEIQNGSTDKLDELNEMWRQKVEKLGLSDDQGTALKNNMASYLANAAEGLSQEAKDLFTPLGENASQGVVDGILEGLDAAEDAGREEFDSAYQGMYDEGDYGSPSKKTYELGKWVGEGLKNGMKYEEILVKNAAKALAQCADIRNMAGQLQSSAQYVGQMIGQGLVNGMNQKLAEAQSVGAKLAGTATAAIQTKAVVQSPSRITTWIGNMIGEGLIVGMEEKMNAVARAAQNLIALPTAAATMASTTNNVATTNNMTFNISGADNPQNIANYVMREIQRSMTSKNGVWA